MHIEVFLEVGKRALYLVVGVRHARAVLSLERKQVRQVEVHAVHCRTKPSVGVVGTAGFLRHAPAVYDWGVVRLPSQVFADERVLVRGGNREHDALQISRGLEPGPLGQIPADDADHVEVAHLHRIAGEFSKQALHAVHDDAPYKIPSGLY